MRKNLLKIIYSAVSTGRGLRSFLPVAPRHAARFRLPVLPPWARVAYALLALILMVAAGTSGGFGISVYLEGVAFPSAQASASAAPAPMEPVADIFLEEAPASTPAPSEAPPLLAFTPGPSAVALAIAVSSASTPTPTRAKAPAQPAAAPTPTPVPAEDFSNSELILRVYKGSQCVVALLRKDGQEKVVRVMICSTGLTSRLTPNGTFHISDKYAYHQLEGAMGQYCTRINDGIMFHSVPIANSAKTPELGRNRMNIKYYNQLGRMASLGCVRLLVSDALWIYENCPSGTKVEIVSKKSPYGRGSKPALKPGRPYTVGSGSFGWDPTDPDPNNPYSKIQLVEPTPTPAVTPTPAPAVTPEPSPEL
jgi:lipoprotein-anchoring transpeptidase ErfK/SrfK